MNTMQPPRRPMTSHVPVRLAGALLQQSNARIQGYRDMANKLERALGDMQRECQDLALAAQQTAMLPGAGANSQQVINQLSMGQAATMSGAAQVLNALHQAAQSELVIQGEIKRWMAGFPPSTFQPPPAPPQTPAQDGPMAAPAIQAPVQQAPGIGSAPAQGPLPVVMYDSPGAAKAAVESTNGATPIVTAAPAKAAEPAATKSS